MSREAIDRARAEINAGWLNGDADAILDNMTDDAMFLGANEPRVDGQAAIRAYLEAFFTQVKMTKADMSRDREVLVSGDLAVERASYDLESTMVGGDQLFSDQGNIVGVWRRQADGTSKRGPLHHRDDDILCPSSQSHRGW